MSFHLRSLEYYASQDAAAGTRVEIRVKNRIGSALQNCGGGSPTRRSLDVPLTQFISFDLYVHILIVSSAVVCQHPVMISETLLFPSNARSKSNNV